MCAARLARRLRGAIGGAGACHPRESGYHIHTSQVAGGYPFPSLLGKVARSAGWGVARWLNPSRIARPAPRTCFEPSPAFRTPSGLRPPPGSKRVQAGSKPSPSPGAGEGEPADRTQPHEKHRELDLCEYRGRESGGPVTLPRTVVGFALRLQQAYTMALPPWRWRNRRMFERRYSVYTQRCRRRVRRAGSRRSRR
jgi:hypothetical protein